MSLGGPALVLEVMKRGVRLHHRRLHPCGFQPILHRNRQAGELRQRKPASRNCLITHVTPVVITGLEPVIRLEPLPVIPGPRERSPGPINTSGSGCSGARRASSCTVSGYGSRARLRSPRDDASSCNLSPVIPGLGPAITAAISGQSFRDGLRPQADKHAPRLGNPTRHSNRRRPL